MKLITLSIYEAMLWFSKYAQTNYYQRQRLKSCCQMIPRQPQCRLSVQTDCLVLQRRSSYCHDLANNQHYHNRHLLHPGRFLDLDVGGGVVLKTRTLNRPGESVVDGVKYRLVEQTHDERRMDACCGCAARWSMNLCDVIGSCKPGWVYVLVTNS